jgi:circadian clock protein KaiC
MSATVRTETPDAAHPVRVEQGSADGHPGLQISTIAHTWIHLSYLVRGGERNRALTIVKSRGTQHSNQVRELVLSATGPQLMDVYSSGGYVLMGTLRWEAARISTKSRTNGDQEPQHGR